MFCCLKWCYKGSRVFSYFFGVKWLEYGFLGPKTWIPSKKMTYDDSSTNTCNAMSTKLRIKKKKTCI